MGAAKGTKPWNAGTSEGWTDKRGYRWRYITVNGKRQAIREHRFVMEQHLQRKLEPWELVHHKNGDKTDNRLENLEVREFGEHTTQHHTGTRRDEEAKRSLEAFALMREELRRLRAVNAELLAACETAADILDILADDADDCGFAVRAENGRKAAVAARAAIAKAKGASA